MKQAALKNEKITTMRDKLMSYERDGNLITLPSLSNRAVEQRLNQQRKNNKKSMGRNNISEEDNSSSMKKMIPTELIFGFINTLQTEMINEIENPEIREDLMNEEVNTLEHQIILLDMIKNYLKTI
jgi:hypothetical protein